MTIFCCCFLFRSSSFKTIDNEDFVLFGLARFCLNSVFFSLSLTDLNKSNQKLHFDSNARYTFLFVCLCQYFCFRNKASIIIIAFMHKQKFINILVKSIKIKYQTDDGKTKIGWNFHHSFINNNHFSMKD